MTGTEKRIVQCPVCSRDVEWSRSSRWRPFCSERCRLIDLGEWLDEGHRIPSDAPAALTKPSGYPDQAE